MKKVTAVDGHLSVNSGQVGLTKAQAASRMHAITLVGKLNRDGYGVYEVTGPLQFKKGESFEFSGETGKGGALRDPEAEALAKLEAEDRIRAEVRAELQAKHEKDIAALNAEHEAALVEQEVRLRAELAPKPQ